MNRHPIPPPRLRTSRPSGAARAALLCAFVALGLFGWCIASPPALAETPPSVYQIIVHPKNPQSALDREFLAQAFLKKIMTWPHGGVIRPVDLALDSPIRRKFSPEILGRSVSAVRNYWLQIVFSGRGVPPPELASDEDVIRFVAEDPGALGYVSNRADTRGVRVVTVR